MKNIFYILAIFNLILLNCFAQPSITWQRLYDGPESYYDGGRSICLGDSGTFYIAGYAGFTSAPLGRRIYVIKLLSNSDTIWTKYVLLNGIYGGMALTVTSSGDGGCVLSGDVVAKKWSIKLDGNGQVVWNMVYSGDYVLSYDIKKTPDNGFLICGVPSMYTGNNVFKIDMNGNLQWEKSYPYTYLYSCDLSDDGGYVIAGDKDNSGIVRKLNSAGDTVWVNKFQFFVGSTSLRAINKIPNGYLVSGCSLDTTNHTSLQGCFTKLDNYGVRYFTKLFNSTQSEIINDGCVLGARKYAFALFHNYVTAYDSVYNRIIITDTLGNILYEKKIISDRYQQLYSIQPDINGDIMFVGETDINRHNTYSDIYVIRTDSMLNFPPYYIGIKKIDNILPSNFRVYQNYPNPFNPKTKIKFILPTPLNPPFTKGGKAKQGGFVTLKIYDILGREVATLIPPLRGGQEGPGTYEVDWDGSNYPSGVYFYRLVAGDFVETKKMILIK